MAKKEPKTATTGLLETPTTKEEYKTVVIPDAEPTPEEVEAQAKANRAKWLKEQVDGLHSQLADTRQRLRDATAEWSEAHLEAQSLKKQVEKLQADLNAIVDDLDDALKGKLQPPLPFAEEEPKEAEPWRKDSVEALVEFGLSKKTAEVLAEAGLPTIGHLADWTSEDKLLTDIQGIGAAKAQNIEDALELYWQKNQNREWEEVIKEAKANAEDNNAKSLDT